MSTPCRLSLRTFRKGRLHSFRHALSAVALLLVTSSPGIADAGPGASTPSDPLKIGRSIIDKALAAAESHKLQIVDPLSLNPPALNEYEPWFSGIPYDKCWKDAAAITCVAHQRTFEVGDGSLQGAGGQPLDWGIVCDAGYSLYQQFKNTWSIVRTYTLDGDIVSRYRIESGVGTVYNSVTGKAAKLRFEDLYTSRWEPPGVLASETITIFGNDWSASTLKGKTLAESWGVVTFFPDGTWWDQLGEHPLDAYFFGDSSGVAPVCDYVR